MKFSSEAYNLIDKTLKEMIRTHGSATAYAKMVGYLMCNVSLTDAKRIAKHEEAEEWGK